MKLDLRFRPALFDSLKHYDRGRFAADVSAGITVGVVALPLAMAFAIASGLKPEAGIFTAIVAGLLISALGGSRVQIGGPAGAFIVIVFGIVSRYGVANLLLATMLAGLMLIAMGAAQLGNLIRFIPVSIVIGFTNGIAVLIALSQVKDFFGLRVDDLPAEFFEKIAAIARNAGSFDPKALGLAVASLALIVLWPKSYEAGQSVAYRIMARIPGTIVALALGALAVTLLELPVETIGSRFGGIPRSLPALEFPEFRWSTVQFLFTPALTIALLGAIESLLCARVADSMTGDRHDPNQELMAQGIANVVAPLFGGFCATGTIARTVTNIRSGAASPVSGIVHALTLLAIVLVAAPLAQAIPLATLSAILMFVAFNMGEWREFARLRQFSMNYRVILLTTFALTVIVDLSVAVEVGLALACLLFIRRVATLTQIEPIELPATGEADAAARPAAGRADDGAAQAADPTSAGGNARSADHGHADAHAPSVRAYRVTGSLFFGAIGRLEPLMQSKNPTRPVVVLDLSDMLNIDTTGLEALRTLRQHLVRQDGRLILCGLKPQAVSLMERAGFAAELGTDNLLPTLPAALDAAYGRQAPSAASSASPASSTSTGSNSSAPPVSPSP
ncbi:MAG TPA: SulP family inorganic anion transporter [Burkholderiaceae bacterium]|nr:SulP family inorganic anion transporter [Burkholderiaceae bacterium]